MEVDIVVCLFTTLKRHRNMEFVIDIWSFQTPRRFDARICRPPSRARARPRRHIGPAARDRFASAVWRRYLHNMVHRRSAATEEAERAGFDLSLIEANLSYSYEKRVLLHDQALALALEFERVGRQLRGDSQSTTPVSLRR